MSSQISPNKIDALLFISSLLSAETEQKKRVHTQQVDQIEESQIVAGSKPVSPSPELPQAGGIGLSDSLPDDFANAILNHFMPSQEAYLQELAELLYFSNYGAGMDNTLLNDIMGFGNASNNYNFANWYNSMGGKATQQQVQQEIQEEENQAGGDLDKAEQALKDIQQKLQDIQNEVNEGKLTPAQGQKLTSQLQSTQANLQQAVQNLQGLVGQLKNAYNNVSKNGTLPPAIVNQLQSQENTVINGDPTNGGFGGLTSISTTLSNNQTEWTSMSTTQQLQLQERMTEIQQEWTVVSTAIQMLNQMYMAPAQGIYR